MRADNIQFLGDQAVDYWLLQNVCAVFKPSMSHLIPKDGINSQGHIITDSVNNNLQPVEGIGWHRCSEGNPSLHVQPLLAVPMVPLCLELIKLMVLPWLVNAGKHSLTTTRQCSSEHNLPTSTEALECKSVQLSKSAMLTLA